MNRRSTTDYIDRWARAALLAPLVGAGLFILSTLVHRQIFSGTFHVGEDEEAKTPELTLPDSWIGGVRIEAHATVPTNRWAAYQVTVLAPDDTVLLELVKEAWNEMGIWREDGESGYWQEDDLDLLWDLRARSAERVKIEVSVLEEGYGSDGTYTVSGDEGRGTEAHFLLPIALSVHARVVDGRFIALAFLMSLAFALLAYVAAAHGGVPVIVESNADSAVSGRGDMAGPGHLVSVSIAAEVDETTGPMAHVTVIVRDDVGAEYYNETENVSVHVSLDEGKVDGGRFSLRRYFELPRAGSWGVYVEAGPDGPMERLKLVVRDRATTRGPVEVATLKEARA